MPSEYMFGAIKAYDGKRRGMLRKVASKLQEIAEQHAADFSGVVSLPGNPTAAWFTCQNLGGGHDQAIERETVEAVKAAGLGWVFDAEEGIKRAAAKRIADAEEGIKRAAAKRIADRVDGYDRDDLGESGDYE